MGVTDMLLMLLNVQTVLVGIAVGLITYWAYDRMKYNYPPGPWCFPIIGNFRLYTHKDIAKFGPLVTARLGPVRVVYLNSLDSVIEALVKRGADFASRPKLKSLEILTQGYKDIALGPYNATWKFQKKVAGKALRFYMQGKHLENMINDVGDRVIEQMETEKEPFFAHDYIDKLVIHMLFNMCFHRKCNLDDVEVNDILRLNCELSEKVGSGFLEDILPFMTKIYTTQRYKDFISILQQGHRFLEKEVREHKETFDASNIRDYTDSILLARQEAEAEERTEQVEMLTDEHIVQIVSDIFFAGLDTTRITLDWFICFMIAHPEIQAKCHQEIDNAIGCERPPSVDDRSRLSYTEACVMETMRMGTVVVLGVPHLTICDTSVAGYKIPKDTMVLINHWALHNDPIFWENVDKFEPTRYLDKDGNIDQKPDNWMPFSAGRRVCLGEPVARTEILLIATKLLQHFCFKIPPDTKHCIETKTLFGKGTPADYKVVIEKRN